MKLKTFFLVVVAVTVFAATFVQAGEHKTKEPRTAVVLAMFGTTVEPALNGLLNIKEEMEKAYPQTEVQLAFTSNIIRKIWQKRAQDPAYVKAHPEVPAAILHAQGPLATIANLQDQGFADIIVQPTHISLGEEYLDLTAYVKALASIKTIKPHFKPFNTLVIGRPALGTFGKQHPYSEDIIMVAMSLAIDAKLAQKNKAALVYMGHGNDYFPSGGAYLQFEKEMRRLYPEVQTYIGTVEGFPSFADVLKNLKKDGIKTVLIKPFMTVAGDHARNDMAGDEADSWQNMLEKEGISTIPVLRGLGEQDAFAGVFVSHLLDTATDAGITLK
jgi:sirohydrochlorin cobaltochelatase